MADNTQLNSGAGGDIISTDVITTLNGGAIVTGEKAQRVKVGFGVDGTFTDANSTNPLPTTSSAVPANVMRDPFNSLNATNWDATTTKAASDLVYVGGNVASASWVGIAKSAIVADTYTEVVSKFTLPVAVTVGTGLSISQRQQGQEFAYDLVGVDGSNNVVSDTNVPDIALANTSAVASGTALTFTTSSAHGLLPGDFIVVYGCTDPRLNYGPIVIQTVPSTTTFTFTSGLGAASYTVGASGFVKYIPADGYATYMAGMRFWSTSSGNIDAVSKTGDRAAEVLAWNPGNTASDAVIPNENGINYSQVAYAYSQRAREEFLLRLHQKYAKMYVKDVDPTSAAAGSRSTHHRSHNIPDSSRNYKVRFRARNCPNLIVPVGVITTASKTASTTATLTIPSHGLTTSDWVYVWGVKDQTNFANLGTATQVASVVDANNITLVMPTSATASSYGGTIWKANGSTTMPALNSSGLNTIAKTSDGLRVSTVWNIAQSNPLVGEVWTFYGVVDSTNTIQTALHGRYRIDLVNATTFTVEMTPLDGQTISALSTTPSALMAATLIKNTEMRLHFFRAESHSNQAVEIIGGEGDNDGQSSITINGNSSNINMLVGSTTPMSQAAQSGQRALGITGSAVIANTDIASVARTASSNTGTIADDAGNALSGLIAVTAASGTTPKLDLILQESFDNGTTYIDTWHAPRITGVSTVPVPYMLITGRRRWAFNINGTTPSFTFSLVSMRGALAPSGVFRNFFDYTSTANGTINVNTLNSTTTGFYVEGCKDFTINVSTGAVTTTAPVFQFQTSPNNVDWFNVGATITTAASTNSTLSINGTPARYARLLVQTAGVGATVNYVNISGR